MSASGFHIYANGSPAFAGPARPQRCHPAAPAPADDACPPPSPPPLLRAVVAPPTAPEPSIVDPVVAPFVAGPERAAETAWVPEGSSIDRALIAILEAPAAFGEAIRDVFDRKERGLRALLVQLSRGEAQVLARRLTDASADDALASLFSRLAPERRTRLLAALAEAGR